MKRPIPVPALLLLLLAGFAFQGASASPGPASASAPLPGAPAISVPVPAGADLASLWAERVKSAVAVEYVWESEVERHTTIAFGTVADEAGTIILPAGAIDLRIPPGELKDFKVYVPGDPDGDPATYLGSDRLTGWHYVRVAPGSVRDRLVPVSAFAAPAGAAIRAGLTDEVWGVGLRNKDEDFAPYILRSHVALIQKLPQATAIAQQEVSGPGLPVFDLAGHFAGLGASSFGQTFVEFSSSDRSGTPIMLVNVEESSAFITDPEVLPYLGRVPRSVEGRPIAWLGTYGLEPVERDVAVFLKLGNRSGAMVSEVLGGSPAEKAGLRARDIILAVDHRPLPRYRPERIVVDEIDRLVAARAPGDTLTFSVLRGSQRLDVPVVLGDEPKLVREADHRYFEKMGAGFREFVYGDSIVRHSSPSDMSGVVVQFVKPNSPADIAELRPDDWVKEIDGAEVRTFADGAARLAAIEADPMHGEVVLQVSRGSDTAILHVKLR